MSRRISLKWFLLTCVALVIPAAWIVRPWVERLFPDARGPREARRAAAIAQLEALGAVFYLDGKRIVGVDIPDKTHPENLSAIEALSSLERVSYGGRGADKLVANLAGQTELRELHLSGSITNEALRTIGKFHRLKVLSLANTEIDDQGLAHLSDLENLHSLDLQNTFIRGRGLVHLVTMKGLESLNLAGTQVDDQSLAALSGLTRLRQLDLGRTKITGPGLAHLRGCRHLHSLSLNELKLADLSAISELDRLPSLAFSHTHVSPQEFRHISAMERLSRISLDGPMYTDEHLAALADADQVREVYVTRGGEGGFTPRGGDFSEQGLAALGSMDRMKSLTITGVISDEEARRLSQKMPKVAITVNLHNRSTSLVYGPLAP